MARFDAFLGSARGRAAAFAAIISMIVLLSIGDLTRNISNDFGVYWSNGWFISQGMLPYEDFFTHKTPLFSVAIAAWMKVFGALFLSAWALKLSTICALTGATYFTARKLDMTRSIAMIATVLVAFYTASHVIEFKDNGLIVVFASIFEIMSIATAYAISRNRASRRYGLATGILLALGMAVRQPAVFLLPAIAAAVVVAGYRKNKQINTSGILWIFVGFFTASVVLLSIYLLRGGSVSAVSTQLIDFNQAYLAGEHRDPLKFLNDWFRYLSSPSRIILTLAVTAAALTGIRRKPTGINRDVAIFLLITSLGIGVSIIAQGRHQDYYFRQFVPIASLLMAPFLFGLFSDLAKLRNTPIVRIFLVTTLIIAGLASPIHREFEAQIWFAREYKARPVGTVIGGREATVANFLSARYPGDDLKIVILGGNNGETYAYARAMPVFVETMWGFLRSPGRISDDELIEWVEKVQESDFDLVLNYLPEPDPDNPDFANDRLNAAAQIITQDLRRVDFPNKDLSIYERRQ